MADSAFQRVKSLGGIAGGFKAFLGGIGFILTHPSVWIYALVPITMMFVLTLFFFGLGIWGTGYLNDWLFGEPEGTWGRIGIWIMKGTMYLAAFLVAVLLALGLAQPLSGFALEAIAHAQEHALTGRKSPKPSFLASLLGSVKVVLITSLAGSSILVALFVVDLIFPPVAIVTVPLKFLVCAWLLAWDFLDYPLGIRGLGFRARLQLVTRNFGAFSAFGIAWAALVFVPGIVLLLLPMGVAGATRLVLDAEPAPSKDDKMTG